MASDIAKNKCGTNIILSGGVHFKILECAKYCQFSFRESTMDDITTPCGKKKVEWTMYKWL